MVQDKKGRDMNKQEEREYWTKLLADGPVWCEVWDDEKSNGITALVVAYVGGESPFVTVNNNASESCAREKHATNNYYTYNWRHATPILTKPRRPWTAEEIMAHGVFDLHGDLVRVVGFYDGVVRFSGSGGWGISSFVADARAICLELRDGILCDTGKRVELYKDGE